MVLCPIFSVLAEGNKREGGGDVNSSPNFFSEYSLQNICWESHGLATQVAHLASFFAFQQEKLSFVPLS